MIEASVPLTPSTSPARLNTPWDAIGRVIWWVFAIAAVGILAASIPAYISQIGVMTDYELANVRNLLPSGMSVNIFAPYETTVDVLVMVVSLLTSVVSIGMGIMIYWRRPGELITLVSSCLLLAYGSLLTGPFETMLGSFPSATNLITAAQIVLLMPGITLFLLLFPDGRFALRWTRWLALALIPITVAIVLNADAYTSGSGDQTIIVPSIAAFVGLPGLALVAQIYRYRKLATPAQRQQTKWVIMGPMALIACVLISVPLYVSRDLMPREPAATVVVLTAMRLIWWLGLIWIPLAMALAVHRYRLWDIDFIINRSLVYGALTVALIGLLAGAFFAIREVLGLILGSDESTIAIVAATLVVAGVFNPARRWLRHMVDQHLYHIGIDYTPARKPAPQSVAAPRSTLGSYEGLELIGRGGMAEVYKATHPTLKRPVAIKVLPHALAQDPDFRHRFEREAKTVAALKHPNIVQLFDFGEADGTSFMVIEYIGGPDVGDVIKQSGAMPAGRAMSITREVASALDYAHQQGLVHRDIKPSNVMLDTSPSPRVEKGPGGEARAVLTDFGIARILGGNTKLTASGMIGTLDYMSPEQIRDAKDVDGRADIYSLGIMLFQMLTGRLPFTASNPGALLIAHLNQPAPDPRTIRDDVPEGASMAALRAMEKDPGDRFQTAGEFAAALS